MPRPRTITLVIELDTAKLTAALEKLRDAIDDAGPIADRYARIAQDVREQTDRLAEVMAATPADVAELSRRASLLGARPPVEVDDPSLPCSAEVDWHPVGKPPGMGAGTVFVATLKADAPIGSGQAGDPVPAIYYRMHDTCRAALADELTDEGLDPRPVVEPSDGEAIDRHPRQEVEGESPQPAPQPGDDDPSLPVFDERGRPTCGASLSTHPRDMCWLLVGHDGRHARRRRPPAPDECGVPVPGDLTEPCYLEPGHAGEHESAPF